MDDDAHLIHSFYASNEGEPLEVVRRALLEAREIFEKADAKLVMDEGAWAVVVGTGITHPTSLTSWFKAAIEE